MSNIIERKTNTMTIATFYEYDKLNKFNYDPVYQRKSVWTEEKQGFFIDSILNNYPIPPIFLHQHIDLEKGTTKYDVIDGKQRLLSIKRFIEGEIPVTSEFDDENKIQGIYFIDLKNTNLKEYRESFWRYSIPVEYIDTVDETIVDKIFDRLNRNGEPLTGQELRNAKYHQTELLDMVENLSRHPFWKQRLEHLDVKRMEDLEFISEILFVILEGGPLGADQEILDELYEKYTNVETDWDTIKNEFYDISRFLESMNLDYEHLRIKGVSHLYGLWCFSHYCVTSRIDKNKVEQKIKRLFQSLLDRTIENSIPIKQYKNTMSSSTKQKSQREKRVNALIQYCKLKIAKKVA